MHRPGETINERYQVVRNLGHGAMGEVYLVTDAANDHREVALKYILGTVSKKALDRFREEFFLLAHLRHPHITAVYDLSMHQQRTVPFFTTEYISGHPFDVATHHVSIDVTIELFVQTLRALAYLHGNGVMHFDIKAHNCLVQSANGPLPHATLIDFGVAATQWQGRRMGTPSYMAPEVVNRERADARADIYSLGVLFFLALTRHNPFRGGAREETYQRQRTLIPPPASSYNPNIPQYLDHILRRLLEKNPDDRYQSAVEVIADLNRLGPKIFPIETLETLGSYVPEHGPFVGRETALMQLQTQVNPSHVTADSIQPIAWIQGRHGVGKTRLLHEARIAAQLAGRVTLSIETASYQDPHGMWTVLERFVAEPRTKWLGIDDLDQLLAHPQYTAIVEMLQQCTTEATYRWHLGEDGGAGNLIVVLTSSGNGDVRQQIMTALKLDASAIATIPLAQFSHAELRAYLSTCTGLDAPPEALITQLCDYTEGNPFLVTETLKAMIREGLLFDQGGRWRSTTFEDLGVDLGRLQVPGSVEAVVATDYAQMTSQQQAMLGLCAVHRQPLPRAAMERLLGTPTVERTLLSLVHRGYLRYDQPMRQYRFRSQAVHNAIYQQLGTHQRTQWHDRIATRLADDPTTEPEHLLHHQQHGSDPCRAQTARWQLAHHYMETHRPAEAAQLFEAYVHHLPESPAATTGLCGIPTPVGPSIYYWLGKAHQHARQYAEAMGAFSTGLMLIKGQNDQRTRHIQLLEAWGETAMNARDYETARKQFQTAAALLTRDDDARAQLLRMDNAIAKILLYRPDDPAALEQAILTFRRTAEDAAQLPVAERERISNNDLGYALFLQGTFDEAVHVLQRDARFYEHTERPHEQIRALDLLAKVQRRLHKHDEAVRFGEAALVIAKKIQSPGQMLHIYTDLGNIAENRGEYPAALAYYERALDLCTRVGDPSRAIGLLINTAILHRRLNQVKRTEALLQSAVTFAESGKLVEGIDSKYGCSAHLELSDLYRMQRRFGLAHQHIADAKRWAKQYPSCRDLLFWIVLTTIETLRDEGRLDEARRLAPQVAALAQSDEQSNVVASVEHSLVGEETTYRGDEESTRE